MTRMNADERSKILTSSRSSMNPIRVIRVIRGFLCVTFGLIVWIRQAAAQPPAPTLPSPFVAVDLNVGEVQTVTLSNGEKITIKLQSVNDYRDSLRGAVRESEVHVDTFPGLSQIFGARLGCGTYHLPVTIGKVQIDCPITHG